MMVMYYYIAIVEYDRRRSEITSAPLDMEYDNNRTNREIYK